ncbi:hypothetical protein HG530_011483 [Fusarium avenaceum]|nr:hypothetical protein HG530_011483 [Fusarium avenaceum]
MVFSERPSGISTMSISPDTFAIAAPTALAAPWWMGTMHLSTPSRSSVTRRAPPPTSKTCTGAEDTFICSTTLSIILLSSFRPFSTTNAGTSFTRDASPSRVNVHFAAAAKTDGYNFRHGECGADAADFDEAWCLAGETRGKQGADISGCAADIDDKHLRFLLIGVGCLFVIQASEERSARHAIGGTAGECLDGILGSGVSINNRAVVLRQEQRTRQLQTVHGMLEALLDAVSSAQDGGVENGGIFPFQKPCWSNVRGEYSNESDDADARSDDVARSLSDLLVVQGQYLAAVNLKTAVKVVNTPVEDGAQTDREVREGRQLSSEGPAEPHDSHAV